MNKRNIIAILGIFLIAIVSYFAFKLAVDNAVSLIKVPFALSTIYPHQKISKEDIEFREIPSYYVDENILIKEEDIMGRYVDIQSKVVPGMLFYKNMIIDETVVKELPALLLNVNQSAFPLSVDLIKSIGGTLALNQKVDVYITYVDKISKNTYVDCLLRSVRIIGIKDRNGMSLQDENAKSVPAVVVLAIDSEYIELVRKASKIGIVDLYAPFVDYASSEESIFNEECKILEFLSDDK